MSTPRWVPAALVGLSLIPVLAGSLRFLTLTGAAQITTDNDRFHTMPLPVLVHIAAASVFCVLGAFQFAPRKSTRHRIAGRVLVPVGLAAAVAGLWLTFFLPGLPGDGALLVGFRVVAVSIWLLALVLGFVAIRAGDVPRHRAWMIRGYAVAQGAGTQALTQLPVVLIAGPPTGTARALALAAGWAINLAVAEWLIRRPAKSSVRNNDLVEVR